MKIRWLRLSRPALWSLLSNFGLDGRGLSVCWNPDCWCLLPKSRRTSSQFSASHCSEHTYIDHSWRCLPQTWTKRRGEGILRMEDAGTSEEDNIDSQDSNTPIDHGHLVRNFSIKIITLAVKACHLTNNIVNFIVLVIVFKCLVTLPFRWLFPYFGHIGIGTSEGIIRDFTVSRHVCEDSFAFGSPSKFIQMKYQLACGWQSGWDNAIEEAATIFEEKKVHIYYPCFFYINFWEGQGGIFPPQSDKNFKFAYSVFQQ